MRNALLPVSALLLSVALLLTANGLLGVLLPLRAVHLGFTPIDVGIMGAAYFSGFVAGCLAGPRLILRVGHIRTFAALVSIVCSMMLLHGLVDSAFAWWLWRGITGLCFAVSYIVIESWLNDKATNENRGLIFSVYTIISLTVITIGQLLVSFADITKFESLAIGAIFVSVATLPVATSIAQAPAVPAHARVRIRYLYACSHEAIIACLGVGMINGAIWTLAPVYALSLSGNNRTAAYFMCVIVIAGAIGQWPLGRLSDRVDRRRVIVGSCAGAFVAASVLGLMAPGGGPQFYLAAAMFGAFAFPLYALCAALLNDLVTTDEYVEAASGILLAYSAGAIVGPILASVFMNTFGAPSLLVYFACIYLAIGGYVLIAIRNTSSAKAEEQTDFADALVMTAMSADIDPRSVSEEPDLPDPPDDQTGRA